MSGILDFSIFQDFVITLLLIDAAALVFAVSWVAYFARREKQF